MDYRARNIEMLFRGLAVLVVFGISCSIPLVVSKMVLGAANDAVIRIDMNDLRNWAKVYELNNGNYVGLKDSRDIKRTEDNIKLQGSNLFLFENATDYCAKSKLRNGFWCIDDSGYAGSGYLNCEDGHYSCR